MQNNKIVHIPFQLQLITVNYEDSTINHNLKNDHSTALIYMCVKI